MMETAILHKKWEVLLIHHSHTDVGYTQSQETIEFYHVNFIKQAVEIAEQLRKEGREHEFIWVCESFWSVECFQNAVDPSWTERFQTCVRNGSIEITGNYLNLNELADYHALKNKTQKAVDFCQSLGRPIKTAMTADINGYGLGYAEALYSSGIRNLFSCVHSHHGMYPLFRKQFPFYWETPEGNKLLVWNGEHYHFGNEFGIVKTATGSYINRDELSSSFTRDKRFVYGTIRMFRFLAGLEKQDYAFDFVPMTIHGLPTDNGSPNMEVVEFVAWWNQNYGDQVTLKLSSLDSFFEKIRSSSVNIETYSGDWPDWWAFGIGANPAVNKIYKEAQRLLQTTKLADRRNALNDPELVEKAEHMLMMYAEHTFGHSADMAVPWNSFINTIDYKNYAYALNAHEYAMRNYNQVLEKLGMTSLKPNREPRFKIINPYNKKVTDCLKLSLDYWETIEGSVVAEDQHGNQYAAQKETHARGTYINCIITLEPQEEKILTLIQKDAEPYLINIGYGNIPCDGVDDIFIYESGGKVQKYKNVWENQFFSISYNREKGITSLYDKEEKAELIDRGYMTGAFMPIYEVTPSPCQESDIQCIIRRKMGRNMRGSNHHVFYPQVNRIDITETGNVFAKIEMDLSLRGASLAKVVLKVYHDVKRIDAAVVLHKDSIWDPESIFIALPFAYNGEKMELYANKTGYPFQIKKDQLPGTNTDFYAIQDGVGLKNSRYGITIAMPDTPLIYTSELAFENAKKLYHPAFTDARDYQLYSWPMNNIWETNFRATQGGFYEFNYILHIDNHIGAAKDWLEKNQETNIGFVSFRIC